MMLKNPKENKNNAVQLKEGTSKRKPSGSEEKKIEETKEFKYLGRISRRDKENEAQKH